MPPASSDANGEVVPGEIHGFIEQWGTREQHDDDYLFQEFLHLPIDEPPAYVQPSIDGHDDTSTYLGSEDQAPPLTFGQTLSPSSHSRASPSSLSRPEDAEPQTASSASWPGQGFEGLDHTDCLRHVGENPEIHIQGPMSPSPMRLQEDDMSIHLSPRSSGLSVTPASPTVQAVPMKRGRSNPLPREKRAKVSNMRKIKACMRCHIRKRECGEDAPCKHCNKAFPEHPEMCVRDKLSDVRFPDGFQGTDIWNRDSIRSLLSRQNWQLGGSPSPVVVTFGQAGDSPELSLSLQSYIVTPGPLMPATSYYPSLVSTGFAGASITMFNNWAWTQPLPNSGTKACLAPGQELLSHRLLEWAEKELSRDLNATKEPGFEAAILSFLLAYRDSPMDLSGTSSTAGKKIGAFTDPQNLVRKICEMRCWYRIWQTPKLYMRAQGGGSAASSRNEAHSQLPVTTLWELKNMAANALVDCEKQVLLELDDLSPKMASLIELPHWACIWQMIFIYRQLVAGHSRAARSQPVNSTNGVTTELNEVSPLSVVEHIYQLMVIKYNAYFGSTSPIYPRKGQKPTSELLTGDERLTREWENVLTRRKEFYRTVSDGVEYDATLRILVVDVENMLERRSRRRAK